MNIDAFAPRLAGADLINRKLGGFSGSGITARRFGDTVTRTLIPSIGLHVALLSGILLFVGEPKLFASLMPLFLIGALCVLLQMLSQGLSSRAIAASRQTTSLFGFAMLTAQAAYFLVAAAPRPGFADASSVVMIAIGCLAVILLSWRGAVQPISMVMSCMYGIVMFNVFGGVDRMATMLLVAAPMLAAEALVLYRLRRFAYLVGVALAGLLAVVLTAGSAAGASWSLAIFAALMMVTLLVYDLVTNRERNSDLLRFLVQGVGVVLIMVTIAIIFSPREGDLALWSALVFAAFAAISWLRNARSALPTQAAWIVILVVAGFIPDSALASCMLAGTIGLVGISLFFANLFVRYLAGVFAAVGLWFAVDTVVYFAARLSSAARQPGSDVVRTVSGSEISPILTAFAIVCGLVAAALVTALFRVPADGTPYWHGLVRRRHAAVIRQVFRWLRKTLKDLPLVGWIYGLLETTIASLRSLKGDGEKLSLLDLLQVCAFLAAAVATSLTLQPYVANVLIREDFAQPLEWARFIGTLGGWAVWGAVLAILGNRRGSLFHSILAFAFFCVPAASQLAGQGIVPPGGNWSKWLLLALLWACPVFLVSLLPARQRPGRAEVAAA